MISIVACCHGAKLCALVPRDFRSQHPLQVSLRSIGSSLFVCKEATIAKLFSLNCSFRFETSVFLISYFFSGRPYFLVHSDGSPGDAELVLLIS